MYIMDGKAISKIVKEEVKQEIKELGIKPKLLVIIVGNDPASMIYVSSKEKACKQCLIEAETVRLNANSSQKDVVDVIEKANNDKTVTGILVQLPLPDHIDTEYVINKIDPNKDVDGLTNINQGKLVNGMKSIIPCTPKGIMRLFREYAVDLNGKNAVVIGRSVLVGKPIALLMLQANATVTIAHSRTKNLAEICKDKDIVVSAVGKAKIVTGDMVKDGAVVIDVGINRVHGTIVGDVDYYEVSEKAARLTPVPGGVGPMTIACLMENVLECYKLQRGIK